jgi:hypothetical protein
MMYGGNTAKDFNAASENLTLPIIKEIIKLWIFRQICFIWLKWVEFHRSVWSARSQMIVKKSFGWSKNCTKFMFQFSIIFVEKETSILKFLEDFFLSKLDDLGERVHWVKIRSWWWSMIMKLFCRW